MRALVICTAVAAMAAIPYAHGEGAKEKDAGFYLSGKYAYYNAEAKFTEKGTGGLAGISASATGKDNLTGFAVAVGYRFNPQFRGEAELGYATKDDVNVTMLMGQFYLDLPMDNLPLKPYANFGIGVVSYEEEMFKEYYDKNPSAACWNLGAGVTLVVTEGLSIDLGYRYVQSSALKYTGDVAGYGWDGEIKLTSHTFLGGLRYIF